MRTARFLIAVLASLAFSCPFASAQTTAPAAVTVPLHPLDELAPVTLFAVDVECNGVAARMTWAAAGPTRISESFAKRCNLKVLPSHAFDSATDVEGHKVFAGVVHAPIKFAGKTFNVEAPVRFDKYCQPSEATGYIGFDIAQMFQWTMDPAKSSLTLRPPGSKPTTRPLATLPLRTQDLSFWIKVTVRNAPADMRLLPGASCVQADAGLQRKWDMSSRQAAPVRADLMGTVRKLDIHGKDTIDLGGGLVETDLTVLLVGNPKFPQGPAVSGGLGQNLLNRYIYCVDPKSHEFRILARISPATQPTTGRRQQ